MRRLRAILAGPASVLLLVGVALSESPSPKSPESTSAGALSNYVIDRYSVNGGGAIDAASAHWKMGMSAGQAAAGVATSASYRMGIGFWWAVGCDCPCHGDPHCDGVPNVQDVVQTVNVGFRGFPAVFDPLCPYEQTDVNCDEVTTVIDVVKMVNVAFRGYDPTTEFCNPCAP